MNISKQFLLTVLGVGALMTAAGQTQCMFFFLRGVFTYSKKQISKKQIKKYTPDEIKDLKREGGEILRENELRGLFNLQRNKKFLEDDHEMFGNTYPSGQLFTKTLLDFMKDGEKDLKPTKEERAMYSTPEIPKSRNKRMKRLCEIREIVG